MIDRTRTRSLHSVVCALAVLSAAGVVSADAPDVAAFADALESVEPAFDRAVDAAGLTLDLGRGRLSFDSGVLIPVDRPGDGPVLEWVFVGAGRLTGEPPDRVEQEQLFYFTGAHSIDTAIRRAVVLPGGAWVGASPDGRPLASVDDAARDAGDTLFRGWRDDLERGGFGASRALLRAAVGDPLGLAFAGAWLDSAELGGVYWAVDPTRIEPVMFGQARLDVLRDLRTRRQRKNDEGWERARRKRGAGPTDPGAGAEPVCGERDEADDEPLGPDTPIPWIVPWMQARLPGGSPDAPSPGFEPDRYVVDMTLSGDDLDAEGSVRIAMRAGSDGLRVVPLSLGWGMDVCSVEDDAGRTLPFAEDGFDVLVALAEPVAAGEELELTVRFAGEPVWRWGGRRGVRFTTLWHPHVGRADLATYDLTLRWPAELTLLASGSPVDGGVADGERWTRNVLDVPTIAASFEIDDYEVVEETIGHIELSVAFWRPDPEMTPARRAQIVTTVKAALLFYESRLGVLPIDRFAVVMTDRNASQGLLGFLTLTRYHMHRRELGVVDNRADGEMRMEVIAHEVAHQWWGHVVGWTSYRDQWLSEAMATFSATEFMATVATDPLDHRRRAAERLRRTMAFESMGGRPLGSLGSITLGRRIRAAHGAQAYSAVVYDKGAAVFATLAERLGRGPAWEMLGALARAVAHRTIRTETFLAAFEQMSGRDLDAFAEQYVYGSGVPVVFYEYEPRRQDDGAWTMDGVARQVPAERYRYVVVRTETGWDVARRFDDEPDTSRWELALPFALDTSTPERPAGITGTLTIRGERTEFSVPVAAEPRWLALDPDRLVLVETHGGDAGSPAPLFRLGEHLLRLGRHDQAEATLGRALAAPRAADADASGETLVVRTRLALARLHLDRHDLKQARRELRAAEDLLPKGSDFYLGERVLLDVRIDVQSGLFDRAGVRLAEFLEDRSYELDTINPDAMLDPSEFTALRFSRGEALALQALVEKLRGYPDADVLIRRAARAGVDVRALD